MLVFEKIQVNNRSTYFGLCKFLKNEYGILVKDVLPEEGKPFSKMFNKNKKHPTFVNPGYFVKFNSI